MIQFFEGRRDLLSNLVGDVKQTTIAQLLPGAFPGQNWRSVPNDCSGARGGRCLFGGEIVALEQAAFGIGMNHWFLVPFIRHGRVFIACEDELVGVCEYMLFPSLATPVVWPYREGVLAEQGRSRRLMEESCLALREAGISTVSLTVHPQNSGRCGSMRARV